jgi:hypothetical protein
MTLYNARATEISAIAMPRDAESAPDASPTKSGDVKDD